MVWYGIGEYGHLLHFSAQLFQRKIPTTNLVEHLLTRSQFGAERNNFPLQLVARLFPVGYRGHQLQHGVEKVEILLQISLRHLNRHCCCGHCTTAW